MCIGVIAPANNLFWNVTPNNLLRLNPTKDKNLKS